jgi:hypothetical protein
MSPDTRRHRGPHPRDSQLFGLDQMVKLRLATADLSWLLSRGYSLVSSLKLVGDRHGLRERQRLAISRAACSDESLNRRKQTCRAVEQIRNSHLLIDGFNLIISLEAGLSGGPLLLCRDDCLRDLASVHGSYRSVLETERAVWLTGTTLEKLGPASVTWVLDRPVSNSGRLAKKISQLAASHNWPWQVETLYNPDARLIASPEIAVTSDSQILDRVECWTNLKSYLIGNLASAAWVLNLQNL